MYYSDKLNNGVRLRDLATTLMTQHRITPNPMNFTVWYEFFSGERPALSTELQDLIDRDVEFTEERCESIFDKHFGFEKEGAAVRSTSIKLESEIKQILGELNRAEDGASGYCERVACLVQEAQDARSLYSLSEIVTGLVAETRDIIVTNKRLEKQLEGSATEVADLRVSSTNSGPPAKAP